MPVFALISVSGLFSLFPLLFKPEELLLKVLILVLYVMFIYGSLDIRHEWYEKMYLYMSSLVFIYTELIHYVVFGGKLEFLPLMMMSVYTAIGILYGFCRLYYLSI